MKRLLLIDGHSVAYRAFFALPVDNFATKSGQATNAVFGFTSMFINVLRDEAPTHVVVAFDVSRHSFRTDEYPDYKATRSASPPEFKGQVELMKEVLAALDVEYVQVEGFEADDLIATLASKAEAAGFEVLICTGDRDALQLVSEKTTVLYPMRGVSNLARMTPEAVKEKYGVWPQQYPDIAALVGEQSDNLPGVPGVGPKTAAKWINLYGGLPQILAHQAEIGGKVGDSLREHVAAVERNRRLNALVRDVGIELHPDDAQIVPEFDRSKIDEVFDALEFSALRDRLYDQFATTGSTPVVETREISKTALSPDGVATWLANTKSDRWGIEFTGSWGRGTGSLDAVAIAHDDEAVWIDCTTLTAEAENALGAWLADGDIAKAVHDAKGPLLAMTAHGWRMGGLQADTAIAAYMLRPDQRAYELADLVRAYLGRDIDTSDAFELQLSFDVESDMERVMERANAVLELSRVLDDRLVETNARRLCDDVELPLIQVLGNMEIAGITVDLEVLHGLESDFGRRVTAAAEAAYDAIGHEVNLGSPKQLQTVLFEELDMPKTKKTKTGWTTDAEALQQLFEKTQHPFLAHLLEHRDANKLRQTVETLRKTVCDDSRVHTTFSQTTAATGRLSSNDPNVQNIPIRTPAGRRIREAFVAGVEHSVLFTADYSQIEMRIMAHMSGEADLIAAFRAGEDFHTMMAAQVFECDPTQVDSELRSRIKAMNYGLAYGLSAYGLSQQLAISPPEAQRLMDTYFERFGKVQEYLQGLVETARKTGFTETIMGRRRYLPDLQSDNRQRREMAERMALNAPIQGSAADLIKVAMLNVASALETEGCSSRLLLQVHDELVLEVVEDERSLVRDIVIREMEGAAELSVPLSVSVGEGRNWFTAGH